MICKITGVCIMYERLKKEKIVVEITNLVGKIENSKKDIDSYCEFMKGVILNTSGLN